MIKKIARLLPPHLNSTLTSDLDALSQARPDSSAYELPKLEVQPALSL